MSILLTASATYLTPRILDPCMQEAQDIQVVQLDAPTAGGGAGIGAESESPIFYFTNRDCSPEDTNAAKKKIIAQRTGARVDGRLDLRSRKAQCRVYFGWPENKSRKWRWCSGRESMGG